MDFDAAWARLGDPQYAQAHTLAAESGLPAYVFAGGRHYTPKQDVFQLCECGTRWVLIPRISRDEFIPGETVHVTRTQSALIGPQGGDLQSAFAEIRMDDTCCHMQVNPRLPKKTLLDWSFPHSPYLNRMSGEIGKVYVHRMHGHALPLFRITSATPDEIIVEVDKFMQVFGSSTPEHHCS